MLYDLYTYEQKHDLLYDNNQLVCSERITDSRPMNERLVKIHKGVDNIIKFRVFNSDRKRAPIDHLLVRGTLINKENNETVYTVEGKHSAQRGLFTFTITEGDLINLAPGFYNFVIEGEEWAIPQQTGEKVFSPFYTDQSANIRLEAEITTQGQRSPVPTTNLVDWEYTATMFDSVSTKLWYSSPVQGARLKNYTNPLHTFSVNAENFRGRLYVKGSLEHLPPAASEHEKYFDVLINGEEYIEYGVLNGTTGMYDFYTGVDYHAFEENLLWLSFYWIYTDANGLPLPLQAPVSQEPDTTHAITKIQIRS